MTSPLKIVPRASDLEILEAHAKLHYQNAMQSWRLFVETCDEIRNSKLYLEKADNWTAYCRATFNLSDSRIRQYRAAIPFAELIQEATDISPTEAQVRNCRAAVGEDNLLLIPVFQAAIELAPNHAPQPRHFKAAYEALKAPSVGGFDTPLQPVTLSASVKEAIVEADLRYKQHIQDGMKEREKFTGTKEAFDKLPLPPDTLITAFYEKKAEES